MDTVTRKARGSLPCCLEAGGSKRRCRCKRCCFLAQQADICCAHSFPGKGLLNKTCWAGDLLALFMWVWAPAPLRTGPVRCTSQASEQGDLVIILGDLEIWEPEESSGLVGSPRRFGKTAIRAAEPAAAAVPEPVPSQMLGQASASSEQAPSCSPSSPPRSPGLPSATSTENHCPNDGL